MKRKRHNELAKANGKIAERRTDLINKHGKKAITPEEESARARKAIHLLLTLIAEEHPHIKGLPAYKEALEWFETFESIKAEIDTELGIDKEV